MKTSIIFLKKSHILTEDFLNRKTKSVLGKDYINYHVNDIPNNLALISEIIKNSEVTYLVFLEDLQDIGKLVNLIKRIRPNNLPILIEIAKSMSNNTSPYKTKFLNFDSLEEALIYIHGGMSVLAQPTYKKE
ncbi:MAG TPA: hypothetical protein VMR49_01825 [Candidatus Paceibacterota bacterium]|nr:hypothetical protein [Candidatus Paceibacterota bacterium]